MKKPMLYLRNIMTNLTEKLPVDNLQTIEISNIINKASAVQAKTIMNHIIDTKFAMMPPEETLPKQHHCTPHATTTEESEHPKNDYESYFEAETIPDRHAKYVKRVLLFSASEVSGRHLTCMPSVKPLMNSSNKYPTAAADFFLKSLE
jgi:hypothetical protein